MPSEVDTERPTRRERSRVPLRARRRDARVERLRTKDDGRDIATHRANEETDAKKMFFDDIGKVVREIVTPAKVGATSIASAAPTRIAPSIECDVNASTQTIAMTMKETIEVAKGVTIEVRASGLTMDAVAANVEANGVVKGLDVSVSDVAADASAATVAAKYANDIVGVAASSSLKAGADVTASACFAIDGNTAVGASAVVSSASGGVTEWSLAAQRVEGPTTLSTSVTDCGNTLNVGVSSELDGNTSAGLRATLKMGERSALGFALAVSKKLSSGDVARVVYSNNGDTDVTYNSTLCKGADVTACLRMAKNCTYKTGFQISLNH